MSTPVILVIDDSATIRKMVDGHLSQEGYRVMLASTAERGFDLACELKPDLILLDHQLPGTTGIEVCRKIIAVPECRHIPFVICSTLRKLAYIEYMDVPNVVDSLPKPFKPELLKMAVANALETAAMVMASQTHGTAVPEVVGETDQPAFSGDFRWLGLREVIDFLNNGRKDGLLEVETARDRVCFFLKDGRIQGVVSASFDPAQIASQLPEALKELSPLLQFTMSSGTSTQVDGLVELMDRKVLDPRILRALLRHQAAVLTRYCFLNNPVSFSFLPERTPPALFRKAPVDSCLAAILIEGAMICSPAEAAVKVCDKGWVRNSLRGQNLDRTGLSAKHAQILSQLDSSPKGDSELAAKAGLTSHETRLVLEGFLLAEWVESRVLTPTKTLIAFEPDLENADLIRGMIENGSSGWAGNVLRDDLSFQLLLKRKTPHAVLIALQGDSELDLPPKLDRKLLLSGDWTVVLIAPAEPSPPVAASLVSLPVVRRPCSATSIARALAVPAVTAGKSVREGHLRNDVHPAPFLEPSGAHS
jgi:CheY-like chemotaxis protein